MFASVYSIANRLHDDGYYLSGWEYTYVFLVLEC